MRHPCPASLQFFTGELTTLERNAKQNSDLTKIFFAFLLAGPLLACALEVCKERREPTDEQVLLSPSAAALSLLITVIFLEPLLEMRGHSYWARSSRDTLCSSESPCTLRQV